MYKDPDIKLLFEPRGVAIIGASSNESKIGHKVIRNIVASGYKGGVYPINPEGGKILGYKVYKNVTEIEGEVDVACIRRVIEQHNIPVAIKRWHASGRPV